MKSLPNMNASKPKSPSKNSPPPMPESEQILQEFSRLTMQSLQLERTIWLMAREHGGAMVIDEASLNPLWDIKYERVMVEGEKENHPSLLKITATQLPEPTDGQIKALADALADQSEEATPQALLAVGLSSYPPSFVVARLAPLVVCRDGKWHRV